jgi:hypothetical protein
VAKSSSTGLHFLLETGGIHSVSGKTGARAQQTAVEILELIARRFGEGSEMRSSNLSCPSEAMSAPHKALRSLALLSAMAFTFCSATITSAQTRPPALFFSDLDSGPNAGGESVSGVAGAYVTLYGNYLGSSQGSSTVTWNGINCLRVVGPVGTYGGWGMPYLWYQKLIVQLGSGCTLGTGNFVVTTPNGASNGIPFTVRSGHIYFASTIGNDSTGTGSFANPWASIRKGVSSLSAGDTVYAMNGLKQTGTGAYSDVMDWDTQGTPGNPVALVAYPGATATVTATSTDFAIRCNSGYSTSICQYSTIAGMTLLNVNGTFALGIQYGGANNWRIIANDMSCPHENGQDGCFHASQGGPWYFYGNYIHDMSSLNAGPTSSKQSHSVYFTTDSNHVWVGWNKWYNNYTCRDLQFHSSPTGGGDGLNQYDLHVHDNFFDGQRCDAINFATIDPSKGPVEAYNNLIINVGRGPASNDGDSEAYAAIYSPNITNTGSPGSGTFNIYNNTFWNDSTGNPFGTTGVLETIGSNMTMNAVNNLVYAPSGVAYVSKVSGGIITGSNNLWFGNGGSPSGFTSNINSDPLFANTSNKDFHLQALSLAIGAGSITTVPTYDHDGLIRPAPPSIGAYEYFSGAVVQKPNPPTNLSISVQ